MSSFREIAVLPPQVRIANRQISHGSSVQRPGYRPTHVFHTTVPSGSGPARKHTAKFEPAAWSWAQMTSGSGARKRVLSDRKQSHSNFNGRIEYLDRRATGSENKRFYPHQRQVLCKHNSFGVGSANPSKRTPL